MIACRRGLGIQQREHRETILSLNIQRQAGGVAAMAIDKPGAINAAIYAAEILGTSDAQVAARLVTHKEDLARSVAEKSARVKEKLAAAKA